FLAVEGFPVEWPTQWPSLDVHSICSSCCSLITSGICFPPDHRLTIVLQWAILDLHRLFFQRLLVLALAVGLSVSFGLLWRGVYDMLDSGFLYYSSNSTVGLSVCFDCRWDLGQLVCGLVLRDWSDILAFQRFLILVLAAGL
ncbi:hypothetical protein U1Q18_034409, partial [Sarracenia purpurea var. burkii]